jgi:hypothetical protein
LRIVLGLGAALACSAGFSVVGAADELAGSTPHLPRFAPSNFRPGQPIDNPYFPLREGFTYHYAGKALNDAGKFVPSPTDARVPHVHKQVDGIQVQVVFEKVYLGGLLQETTQDYYAQDHHGNVWYMGEFETSFIRDKHGNVTRTSHEGSWEAGVNGAKPGFIMPAHPTVGFSYFQEHAPPVALDTAKVTATDLTLNVRGTVYHHVLLTREFTQLEPTVLDFKWYAPGVGNVLEREFTNGKLDAELHFTGITPNDGSKLAALYHGAPGHGMVQVAAVLPREIGHGAPGSVTIAQPVAHTGVPAAFPVDGHAPLPDLTTLF